MIKSDQKLKKKGGEELLRVFKVLLVLCALLAFSAQADALTITPATGSPNVNSWQGYSGPGVPDILNYIKLNIGIDLGLYELYKCDVGNETNPLSIESGFLSGSYETSFGNEPLDPSEAIIQYTGMDADIVGPTAYLLVKDGNGNPNWYLFNLTSIFNWNGMETLYLEDFWPQQGAISHVSLYGTRQSVPEPATMLLMGTGLIGLAGIGRKKFFKKG